MVFLRRRTLEASLAPFGSGVKLCSSSDHGLHRLFRGGWEQLGNSLSHFLLLLFYVKGTIDDRESLLFGHEFILFDDSCLEHSVALKNVVAEVQVHSCFVELQFRPAHENALHRNFDWYSEVEANVRCRGEAVRFPNPVRRASSDNVSSVGCICIPIR